MNQYDSLGYWVRRRRKALDLTQGDLARQVYCSLSMIKKIELDERRPSPLMAERLANCLHIQGTERQTFLAVANADQAFDRLNLPVNPIISTPQHSNLFSFLPPTPFVGYKNELEQISCLIHQQNLHLITLVGPGGIGKTRLSIQAAYEQLPNYPDGVFFIPLDRFESPSFIPSAILDALSVPKHMAVNLRAYLLDYLHDKSMLLVLDNFEHMLDGCDLVIDIQRVAPEVVILATSRVPLSLTMEHVVELKGMAIGSEVSAEDAGSSPAVQLFVQTATQVGGKSELTQEDLASIIHICQLVDGFPLAIELAASWARIRTLADIEHGILAGLDFLTTTKKDVPERHRSMQAAFEFSWQFLSKEEKRVFSILSIFRGGFHLRAAVSVTGCDQAIVEQLANKSLLHQVPGDHYNMHELLRKFSMLKCNDPERLSKYKDGHLEYYVQFAEQYSNITRSVEHASPIPIFVNEIDNFRAALAWSIERRSFERGVRLATALGTFWNDNGDLLEGSSWLTQLLEIEKGLETSVRIRAIIQVAKLTQNMGDFEQALLWNKESLALSERIKDKAGIGISLMMMGTTHYLNGDFVRGSRMLYKSVQILRETQDEMNLAISLIRYADTNMRRGMLNEADGQFNEAYLISTRINNQHAMAFALGGRGDIRRLQGRYRQALEYYQKSLKIHWEENQKMDLPFVIEAIALNYASIGYSNQSVVLWGAAENLRDELHSPVPPSYKESYAPTIQTLQASLGENAFNNAWQLGRSAPLERVIKSTLQ